MKEVISYFKQKFTKIICISLIITILIIITVIISDQHFKTNVYLIKYVKYIANIPDSFFNQTIDILISFASTILTLLAILTALHYKNLETDEVKNIKEFLENFSKNYANYSNFSKDYRQIADNTYDIYINLQKYNVMYTDFMNKSNQVIHTNKLYERLSDLSFSCYFIAIYLNILTINIYFKNIYLLILSTFFICLLFMFFWSFYKLKLLPLIQIKKYNIDFPTYENLISINKHITVPYSKVLPTLPLKLFSLSSYFKLSENFYGNIQNISLVTLSEYNINVDTKITIEYGYEHDNLFHTQETILLSDMTKQKLDGCIYYSIKPNNNQIYSFTITIKNIIFDKTYETLLIYTKDSQYTNTFICTQMLSFKNNK